MNQNYTLASRPQTSPRGWAAFARHLLRLDLLTGV
jgi:hypothetical protein